MSEATPNQPDPLAENVGVNAVERVFLKEFRWAFRRQTVIDWGIDAQVEIVEGDQLTGRLLALQIKSGTSYFRPRGEEYVFHGSSRHLTYWTNHSLPVFIILHNPETNLILWQKFERRLVGVGRNGRWSIPVPRGNVLSARFKTAIQAGMPSDIGSFRRWTLALDYPTIRLFKRKRAIYLKVHEWVNKTLNMRDAFVYFNTTDKAKADLVFERWVPMSSLSEFMALRFPWLDFEYSEPIEDLSGEVAVHTLKVAINELGRAVIRLKHFYNEGAAIKHVDPPESEDDDEMDEDEWNDYLFRRAVERDD